LDKRQVDIDSEVENLKLKITEIKTIKDRAETLEADKRKALEKVAHLSEEEAKGELLAAVEKKYEEDILFECKNSKCKAEERLENALRKF
jgi:hypothetical protein